MLTLQNGHKMMAAGVESRSYLLRVAYNKASCATKPSLRGLFCTSLPSPSPSSTKGSAWVHVSTLSQSQDAVAAGALQHNLYTNLNKIEKTLLHPQTYSQNKSISPFQSCGSGCTAAARGLEPFWHNLIES